MNTQIETFRRLVRHHMGPAPACVTADTALGDVIAGMSASGSSAVIVIDDHGQAQGILTEQDIARRITFRLTPDDPVSNAMSAPLITVNRNDYLFHAIAFMRRHRLRHIPVLDEQQRVCGMLAQHEALTFSTQPLIELIDQLTHENSLQGLRSVKLAQAALAELFLADNVPVPEVQALITEINSDLHRRVLQRALNDMQAEDWGEPPVPFALIVMGSGGRGENFLCPDQDNGFILADYPDEQHDQIDAYFIELAERMTKALDQIGFPLCRGHIMATNPVWRKTLSQWRHQVVSWMRRRSTVTLRLTDILFDFDHVYGDENLSQALRGFITPLAQQNRSFIQRMYAPLADYRVALSMFNRLITERDRQGRPGMINLKYGGTLRLVEAIRLLALLHGIPVTSTLERIRALHARGVLDSNRKDYLSGALAHITLLLRQQVQDFKAGKRVGNHVAKAGLSRREQDYLKACFRAITRLRGSLRAALSANVF